MCAQARQISTNDRVDIPKEFKKSKKRSGKSTKLQTSLKSGYPLQKVLVAKESFKDNLWG